MNETFGYMTVHPEHELSLSEELGKRCSAYGLSLFRFCPLDIDPVSLQAKGKRYKNGGWENTEEPIPFYIYDRCFYGKGSRSAKSRPITEWLKKHPERVFLGKGLPSKWEVHEFLSSHPSLSFYMPETIKITHFEQISIFLLKERACLLKPAQGSQARGIIAVRMKGRSIEITYHAGKDRKTKSFAGMKDFEKWFNAYLKQSRLTYLLQPLLSLQNKNGYPFDIRTLLQKDENGEWQVRGKGIRSGYQGSFVSNLGSGGESSSFQEWIETYPRKMQYLINDELDTILRTLPEAMEERFSSLFELGLDIGFSKNGSLWILDVNSKPGHKLILKGAPEQAETLHCAPLAYCKHLMQAKNAAKDGVPE
ncbi:YheC/YheD family protein [Metabacillus sp. GX 13764]|uniref:YheC/YheD family endospore coat-associated protein n=1 Tax=Metabacillus kandeliae TaxID=2900151 RepID=UPI001E2E37EF|nr:YheC/YheD family protein [Metabacillus kandeliae]MCD7034834.1 YheC/YheD family protein [Metabacillus kandeliae]